MTRQPDKVKIEVVGSSGQSGTLDNFNTLTITNDITMPSEAAFELGDNGTWETIKDKIAHGTIYKVFVNGKLMLTGRVELDDVPIDSSSGAEVRFTVRTKLADASFATAKSDISVKKTTIKDFILALYSPLGYVDSDFEFKAHAARDLLTGVDTSGKGQPLEIDLEPMKEDDAKVSPPETIFSAADRHLRRFGLMHWDSPDGRIVISYPNDTQAALYNLRINRGSLAAQNNVLKGTRTMDWSGIPSVIGVFGKGGKRGRVYSRIGRLQYDSDVYKAGFYRPVMILAEGLRNETLADRAASRELSAKSKNKDAFVFEIDGLSYWDGQTNINWAIDSVASVSSNIAGVSGGAYYLHRTVLTRNAGEGDKTNLTMLAKGIWKL